MTSRWTRRSGFGRRRLGRTLSALSLQLQVVRVFDELIQNRDRNQGNILWTSDWKMWLIDHTRAFGVTDW